MFIKSSFLNRILSRCPNTHSGSALPSGQEGNVKNMHILKKSPVILPSCALIFFFFFYCSHTRMPIIERVWVCFVVLLCFFLHKLWDSESYSTSTHLCLSHTHTHKKKQLVRKGKTNTDLVRMVTSSWVLPCCSLSHCSSRAVSSALESTLADADAIAQPVMIRRADLRFI